MVLTVLSKLIGIIEVDEVFFRGKKIWYKRPRGQKEKA
jgi:hypothetical protein